jgi:membrane protease YdiL (CAAX protease family)
MNRKQMLAVVAPLLLVAVMYPVFRFLAGAFQENWRLGWYFGLIVYWLIWGAVFPLLMLGKDQIRALILPQKAGLAVLVLVIFPALMAAGYKLVTGMHYEISNAWILLLLLSTSVGNGFFEEILWRGVYLRLFPESVFFRLIWPTTWFALWHYIPGSVAPDGNVIALIVGAGFFGFYLGFLARSTNTVWWCIVAHIFGGIVMVT